MLRALAAAVTLTLSFSAASADGAYPGRNGRVVFVAVGQGRGGFGWQAIRTVRADGSGMRWLSHGDPDEFVDFDPVWSPDGRRIAFVRSFGSIGNGVGPGTRGSELYVMNADGTRKRRLTRNTLAEGSPSWSPDGRRLVFTRGGTPDLWTMNADGTRPRRVTRTAPAERDPAWAPRGNRIAFTVGGALWTSTPSGRERRVVVPTGVSDPSWSPDGTQIAFSSSAGVMVVDRDGSNLRLLAPELEDPAWAPDGSRVVAASAVNPFVRFKAIFVVSLAGVAVPITRDPIPPGAELIEEHSQPDWQPLR